MSSFPEILLRDIQASDLPILFEHQRDPVAVALVVFRSRERAEFNEHWAKILANDECLKKTIVADGQVAGHIGSFGRDGKREVGYWIDRTLWGHGIMSQALPAFLRLEQQRPLYAGVAPHNLASMRLLEKCGFTLCESAIDEEPELEGESHISSCLQRQGYRGLYRAPVRLVQCFSSFPVTKCQKLDAQPSTFH